MEITKTVKNCSKCNTQKDIEEFHKSTDNGYQAWCRDCYSAYYKAYNREMKASEAKIHVESKVCLECGLKKPRSQFGKREHSPDKLLSYCKPCWRVRCNTARRKRMLNDKKN